MPPIDPFRLGLAEALSHHLAESLCPWCGDDYDYKRHPHAPPIQCPWCEKRAKLIRRASQSSRASGGAD